VHASQPWADPLEELAAIPDPQERLGWIVERGRRTAALPPEARTPAHRVPGCVSAVWILDECDSTACRFRGDAEAPILRGLTALVCSRAEGRRPVDVAADTIDIISALGLERHLTPTRVNGLRALQAHVRRLAALHAEGAGQHPAPPP
jgi:cysteine desulfuration protein SufE